MAWVATAIIGAGALGAGASIWGANKAAEAQTAASRNALAMESSTLGPYVNAGQSVLPTLQSLLTPGPNQTATLSQMPGFQFAQDWGQKAVQNLGTTRGLGGNVLTAGANYATGLAQQGWLGQVGALQNFANMGSGSAGQFANAASGTMIGAGNAAGGASTATGNAIAGMGGSVNTAALWSLLNGGGARNTGMYGGNAFEQGQVLAGSQVM